MLFHTEIYNHFLCKEVYCRDPLAVYGDYFQLSAQEDYAVLSLEVERHACKYYSRLSAHGYA